MLMQPRRLLVLDDDPLVGSMIRYIAEAHGMPVRVVSSPGAFFHTLAEWQPSLIAVDLVMPEMDGVEVLTRLAAQGCTARIIITSGVGSRVLDAARRSAHEHGLVIAGVLSKPFSPQALRKLLDDDAADAPAPHARPAISDEVAPPPLAAADLDRALELGELALMFQPQVECQGGRVAGFEALVRWQHPVHGLILPDRFIPLAEEHDLIDALTEQVFDGATAFLASSGLPGEVTMAVNMSSRSTAATVGVNAPLVERFVQLCERRRLNPSRMVLELTESTAMKDPVNSLAVLTRLRMKGLQLSIDDFGTGYSSMLQLVRLPFSELKIDRSFVSTAVDSLESRAVVRSIIELGHSLELRVVAEGVENAAIYRVITEMGCDLAQGWHVAPPMTAEAALQWTRLRERATPWGQAQASLI